MDEDVLPGALAAEPDPLEPEPLVVGVVEPPPELPPVPLPFAELPEPFEFPLVPPLTVELLLAPESVVERESVR